MKEIEWQRQTIFKKMFNPVNWPLNHSKCAKRSYNKKLWKKCLSSCCIFNDFFYLAFSFFFFHQLCCHLDHHYYQCHYYHQHQTRCLHSATFRIQVMAQTDWFPPNMTKKLSYFCHLRNAVFDQNSTFHIIYLFLVFILNLISWKSYLHWTFL